VPGLTGDALDAQRRGESFDAGLVVDVLTAVIFGSVVFGDHLGGPPGRLLLTGLGAALVGVSVWRLVRESERLHERSTQRADPPPEP
jgi:hypothetical protein